MVQESEESGLGTVPGTRLGLKRNQDVGRTECTSVPLPVPDLQGVETHKVCLDVRPLWGICSPNGSSEKSVVPDHTPPYPPSPVLICY